jgi:C_GCAxxG_C_C family probable redox protein
VQDTLGTKDDAVFKAASGLGGGIGGMRDTCGALIGGAMLLGFRYGRSREEIEKIEKARRAATLVKEYYQWFEKEFCSTNCKVIRTRFGNGVYYDTSIPEQDELACKSRVPEKCADLTGKVASKIVEMIGTQSK